MMRCIKSPLSILASQLLHRRCPAPMIRTATGTTTLVPSVVMIPATVKCFGIRTDIGMDVNNQNNHQPQPHFRPNNYPARNDTELHMAAQCGNTAKVREVVHRNRELLWCNNAHQNLPLHLAVENAHKEVALYLVKEYPQASYALNQARISPLYLAVERHLADLVDYMLKNLRGDSNVVNNLKQGKPIVHASITAQNQELLQLILKHKKELLDSQDGNGLTPLSYAAYRGDIVIVRYLLKKFEESISMPNTDGSYPIHKACMGGSIDVLKSFYSRSHGSVLMADGRRRTILHLAAKEPHDRLKSVVTYLLRLPEGRQLMKMQDENRWTALDLANQSRNGEVVDILTGTHR